MRRWNERSLDPQDPVRRIALEVGFDEAGWFSLDDPAARASLSWLKEVLLSRAAQGRIHKFAPSGLASGRIEGTDPETALPGARSVIAVALSFNSPVGVEPLRSDGSTPSSHGSYGLDSPLPNPAKLARYSAHNDYHPVVDSMLSRLEHRLAEEFGRHHRFLKFCDTGPVLDRHMAVTAGIGYYGKNCSVINERLGSWMILGGLITTISLEPPMCAGYLPETAIPANSCGNCDLCIRACPTGALEGPFKLNPQRCLSGITQMRGNIPEEFRIQVGNRLFGCDTCQEVCPKNIRAARVVHPELIPKSGFARTRSAARILTISPEDFSGHFSELAAGWRGRNTLRRNAAIICGNSRNPGIISHLGTTLRDPSPVIRAASAWALGRFHRSGDPSAALILNGAANCERDPGVRREINEALHSVGREVRRTDREVSSPSPSN